MDQSKVDVDQVQVSSKGGEIKSTKEEGVVNKGRNKGGVMDLGEAKSTLDDGKHPSKCK